MRKPDDAGSLGEKLESMTHQVSSEFQVPVAWSMSGTPFTVTEPVAHDLLMVAREAVYNSMLHGHPVRVDVALRYKSSELVLHLDDDGCGFDPPADRPRERPPLRTEGHEGAGGTVGREVSFGERAGQRRAHRSAGAAEVSGSKSSESARAPSFSAFFAEEVERANPANPVLRRTKKQSGSCDPDCQSEGAKSEGQPEGALEDTRGCPFMPLITPNTPGA